MTFHRSGIPGLVLAAAGAVAIAGCGKKPANATDPTTPTTAAVDSSKTSTLALPVVGEPVRKGDLILTVNARGQIMSDAVTTLNAQAQGVVDSVLIHPGDAVKRGQLLVRLDAKPLELDVRSAQAALNAATVKYNTDVYTDSLVEGAVRPERRTFLRAQDGIEGAQVQLDKAKLALEHGVITAPFDGMIENVAVSPGDQVNGGAVATIVDMSHLRVEAEVLEHDLPLLRIGGEAIVTVAAFPDRPVRGTIAAILPLVDSATRAGRAIVRIAGNGELRPGMYADVKLEAARLPNRIIVPARAVIERDNRPLVFVARNGIAEWVYVNAGRSNGQETEILPDSASGIIPLKPGDMVITDGQITLTHQAPIKLTPRRSDSQ